MADEDADDQRIKAALNAALDELDSDEEDMKESPKMSETRSPATTTTQEPEDSLDVASPEALLENFIEKLMINGNEDELLGKVMGEMEAHIRSTVSQQQEASSEISGCHSEPNAASPTDTIEPPMQTPQSSNRRKHSCERPPREELDAAIGTLFEEITSEQDKLNHEAATKGQNFQPPDIPEDDPVMQRLMKDLEGLNANDFDTDAVIDGMMEQLLSKDLMYQPMKQVAERFPSWLDANKSKLSEAEYQEREKQCNCFQRLVSIYESDPSNTDQIMNVMEEVQEYGQPPAEIIRALGIELNQDGLPMIEECNMM